MILNDELELLGVATRLFFYSAPRLHSRYGKWLIWIRPIPFFLSRLTDGIPVLAKDFSQSWIDGPRILPSIYASPGQREHEPEWTHCEHPSKSAMLMERTSWNCGESRQMSMNFCWRTLPVGNGNCTQG